jgi:hypothetical protein
MPKSREILTLPVQILLVSMTALCAQDIQVDQSFLVPNHALGAYNLDPRNGPAGQSFVPRLGALDFFDYYTADFLRTDAFGGQLSVDIRQGTINGPIVGRSMEVFLPNGFEGPTRFTFSQQVQLVPGTPYVAQIHSLSPFTSWVLGINGKAAIADYPDGTLITPTPAMNPTGFDAWFQEGIVIPEPSRLGLLAMTIGLGLFWRFRQQFSVEKADRQPRTIASTASRSSTECSRRG